MADTGSLRVAIIAGSLGQGGAEKQAFYLARALRHARIGVHLFTLTRGERLEPWFAEAGIPVTWVGRFHVPIRPIDMALAIRRFRPHVVQAAHYFTNLYVVAAAHASGAVELGTVRNDLRFDMAECGPWGTLLLRAPRAIVVNSSAAAEAARALGVPPPRVHMLANAIDLAAFDREVADAVSDMPPRVHVREGAIDRAAFDREATDPVRDRPPRVHVRGDVIDRAGLDRAAADSVRAAASRLHASADAIDLTGVARAVASDAVGVSPARGVSVCVIAVARLVAAKRLDRLLRAIAAARRQGVDVRGLIVGEGPERPALHALARDLALWPDGVAFAGARADVPRLLAGADLLALTSQHEGCPNVVLEAMAARLPVVTTPAGDAATVVRHGETGFVVPFDDDEALTRRLIELARSPALRRAFGDAGRARVEADHRVDDLAERALRIYQQAAAQQRRARTQQAVAAHA